MKFILLVLIIAGGYWFYQSQQSGGGVDKGSLDTQVRKVAEATAKDPKKSVTTSDIQKLSNAMNRTQDPHTKGYLIRLISLGMLAKKDFRSFHLFRKKVEADHPDEDFFAFMEDDFPGTCSGCEGKGASKCTKCKGEGKCSNFKCDEGRIKYETFDGKSENRECSICKGKAKCITCGGTGSSRIACTKCKGTGQKGVSSTKADKLYKDSLKDAE